MDATISTVLPTSRHRLNMKMSGTGRKGQISNQYKMTKYPFNASKLHRRPQIILYLPATQADRPHF